jgi:hypothetical protein
MLQVAPASSGLLFFSVLYRPEVELHLKRFDDLFGEFISYRPSVNPLRQYYAREMGEPLERIFFVSTKTYAREFLLSTKLLAQNWEAEFAISQKRQMNIDVGFISLENFILATTKNYSHRVFIGQNIFADLTYQFINGTFEPLPWCYPDYQDEEKKKFLNWCRTFLLMQSAR